MDTASVNETVCPACGLAMPKTSRPTTDNYYNATRECWNVYTEVLEAEYSNAVLFGQVHQLTVDTYAVQHAGGKHPDKSIAIHLAGLYLVLDRGLAQSVISQHRQRLANTVKVWPHFTPPEPVRSITVFDVAVADSHADAVEEWSRIVWKAWSQHHSAIAQFVAMTLPDLKPRASAV